MVTNETQRDENNYDSGIKTGYAITWIMLTIFYK